jgi:hypothetical protein
MATAEARQAMASLRRCCELRSRRSLKGSLLPRCRAGASCGMPGAPTTRSGAISAFPTPRRRPMRPLAISTPTTPAASISGGDGEDEAHVVFPNLTRDPPH